MADNPKLHVNVGDRVKLKDYEGPEMIAREIILHKEPNRPADVVCFWFAGEVYQQATFSMKWLDPVKPVEP